MGCIKSLQQKDLKTQNQFQMVLNRNQQQTNCQKRHAGGSNYYPLDNRRQFIPLRYCVVMRSIVKQILDLSIYEKFRKKTFQKGSAKWAAASSLRPHEKARTDLNLRAFRLRTATEPLLYWRVDEMQKNCSLYNLALFK